MDYAHARHAGNFADVFKHVALTALCEALPALYVETHAGDGRYPLASVGEWGEGVARLWDRAPADDLLGRYLALVKRLGGERHGGRPLAYPGSPLLARALLPQARVQLFELDERAAQLLRAALGADERVSVSVEDGLAGAGKALASAPAGPALALVDPPFSDKAEWTAVARALPELAAARPDAALALWYPIKAMTRPAALLGELAKAGLRGTAVELVATPLRLGRDRLNGCGMLFVRAPDRAVQSLCAALPELGQRLQTRGEWTARLFGF